MHCSSCSSAVERALSSQPGVLSASVALLKETAEVVFDDGDITISEILKVIQDAGFMAELLQKQEERTRHEVAVETALGEKKGVQKALVSLTLKMAEVTHDPQVVNEAEVVALIEEAGFEARVVGRGAVPDSDSAILRVSGMTCSSCSSAVELALLNHQGVQRAAVNLLAGKAEVQYNPDVTGPRHIIQAVQEAGFEAHLLRGDRPANGDQKSELQQLRDLFFASACLTIPVFLVAMVFPMIPAMRPLLEAQIFDFPLDQIIKCLCATPVQFVIGWRFHINAWRALRNGRANMDVLVSLGTNASYLYSMISILHHHFMNHHKTGMYRPTDFFETSAMLITFILLGKYLEASAKGKTSEAIGALLNLTPPTAVLLEGGEDGKVEAEREVPTALIHRGDRLKVLPGARMPVDGLVLSGKSHADESMLTGEAEPVLKVEGDAVIGGTMNMGGALQVRATRVGKDTALAQIVQLVEAAQMSKAPIQAFADYVSSIFVPIVVTVAMITCFCWYVAGKHGWFPQEWLPAGHNHFLFALLFGIAVLVIACPCALGLATPTAVMVGTGVAASHGILIKGADALERAHRIRTIVFDKTGTLTRGKPVVTDVRLYDTQASLKEVMHLAAALEVQSEHPLASAVINFAAEGLGIGQQQVGGGAKVTAGTKGAPAARRLDWVRPAKDVLSVAGKGVLGWVAVGPEISRSPIKGKEGPRDVKVILGNKQMMADEGIPISKAVDDYMRDMEAKCCTCVMVALAGSIVAVLAVTDPLKPEARGVVAALARRGLAVHLVTGDNWRTARAIAEQLAIINVCAECLPGAKVDKIRGSKKVVAMVGDGVNDSPALAAADVGIAVGSGTDIAIEAADYVLMRDDLEDVLVAIDLSRKTFNRIRVNYFWAMGYNVVMIPFAAGIPPWVAGALMVFSSVSVVCSSLLLRNYKRPKPVLRDVAVLS
ncbi:heavy metal P-type ATPase [Coccomyxa subellipsoidea C-169]|uniref:P-type Cu(+) transporter n=1 Tax=Coccomyxa subellipsoidea (strain C-169) TaxID=574566 RepID=I0Z7R9_COCSC|nr:heavy metal P-type ATPase [Coccomyxa subellipsoidea C-169]EIE26688.1 heavy metal P-type ATPase [Coccomyxa subellipsoidea C-169]|eukprot:XP_005651232.1 heavy metal P-type ATPase [Coccomyxa subellipsoidea C-169]